MIANISSKIYFSSDTKDKKLYKGFDISVFGSNCCLFIETNPNSLYLNIIWIVVLTNLY